MVPVRPPACLPAVGYYCSPSAGQGRPGPAMESYDIIANQPVVIDNVRLGNRGEGGRPAPGGGRGEVRRDPLRSWLVLDSLPARHSCGLSRAAGPAPRKRGRTPAPALSELAGRSGEEGVPYVWQPLISIWRAGVQPGDRPMHRCARPGDSPRTLLGGE